MHRLGTCHPSHRSAGRVFVRPNPSAIGLTNVYTSNMGHGDELVGHSFFGGQNRFCLLISHHVVLTMMGYLKINYFALYIIFSFFFLMLLFFFFSLGCCCCCCCCCCCSFKTYAHQTKKSCCSPNFRWPHGGDQPGLWAAFVFSCQQLFHQLCGDTPATSFWFHLSFWWNVEEVNILNGFGTTPYESV